MVIGWLNMIKDNYERLADPEQKEGEPGMKEKQFFEKAKAIVCAYANDHLDVSDGQRIGLDDVYIVWSCKILQNWKALLSTTLLDGMYYELTYNGNKREIYLDAYKKFENRCIRIEEAEQ